MGRTRNDPRREATRLALIESAETLFAEQGIDAVSLRQIGLAIGSENTSVVAYHFGTKQDLIEAIYRHRLPDIDRRRGELMRAADRIGQGQDLSALMLATWVPIYQQTNGDGRHSYAGFLVSILRSRWAWMRETLSESYPDTEVIFERIWKLSPLTCRAAFTKRFQLATILVVSAVEIIDLMSDDERKGGRDDALFADAIEMGVAALGTPAPTGGMLQRLCAEDARDTTIPVAK